MVRSLWIRALATTLVWTSATWAQQSTSAVDDKKTEQILTIQEAGKSPLRCKVVNSWRTEDGHQAYQVRSLDTGEMLTVTEKSTASSSYGAKPQTIATQIFHWGNQQQSPPGIPAPSGAKPITSPTSNKSMVQSGGGGASPYATLGTDGSKSGANSSYSSVNKPATQIDFGAKNITTPVPEKDWRQSWAKSDERPLRIEDKPPVIRDSIADVPRLRIDGRPPSKDSLVESQATMNQRAAQPKGALSPDDPLLHPDNFMPKLLDVTPMKKVPTGPASSSGGHDSGRTPAIADLAGARPELKSQPTMDKSRVMTDDFRLPPPALPAIPQPKQSPTIPSGADQWPVVVDAGKMADPAPAPNLPVIVQPKLETKLPFVAEPPMVVNDTKKNSIPLSTPVAPVMVQPTLVPTIPILVDKPKVVFDAGKIAAPVTIPDMPFIAEPAVIPPAPSAEKPVPSVGVASAVDQAGVSVAPMAPQTPLAVTAPADGFSSHVPMQTIRGERSNFLVMDAGNSGPGPRSIRLPAVPTAVVAFGQPVTVTSPPPDMVRKKSLEAHAVRTMIVQLKESLYPSQREQAAEGLTSANLKIHPEAVEALCTAAVEDPAPLVRAQCAESLAVMNVRTDMVLNTIHKLQADKDDTVRAQADEAMKVLERKDVKP